MQPLPTSSRAEQDVVDPARCASRDAGERDVLEVGPRRREHHRAIVGQPVGGTQPRAQRLELRLVVAAFSAASAVTRAKAARDMSLAVDEA